MILQSYVFTKISPSNQKYWKSLGYQIDPTGGRGGKNTGQRIKVSVLHLQRNSCVNVSCRCDECGKKYIQRFSRNKEICYECRKSVSMKGNTFGSVNKGKKLPQMQGENNPRWNPNKTEFRSYANRVRWISEKTYRDSKHTINPNNHPRGRCGVPGAYQLDHKKSVKNCFLDGWSIEQAGSLENLQMLSWTDNRQKW